VATYPQLAEWLIDQMGDAMIFADEAGLVRRWNHVATAVFGFTAEEMLGSSLDLIIPEHLRAPHWAGYQAAMASGKLRLDGRPTLTRGLHKSGRRLYVEMTFALVKNPENNQVIGSVAVARDVTERMEQQRAARQKSD